MDPTEMFGSLTLNESLALLGKRSSDGYQAPGQLAFDNLYPAVVECFFVIACG
jgi:hypothetical protein